MSNAVKPKEAALLNPFPEALHHYRTHRRVPLTQREVALYVAGFINKKFSRMMYQHIERGRRKASIEVAIALSRIFEVDVSMIFDVPESMKEAK